MGKLWKQATAFSNEKSPPNYRSKGFSFVAGSIEISNLDLLNDAIIVQYQLLIKKDSQ